MKLAHYIKDKLIAAGADDVVITVNKASNNFIKFYNNKIGTTKNWDIVSLDIFLAIKQRLVTTTLKDFSQKSADYVIKNLLRFAGTLQPNPEYLGIAKGPFKYRPIKNSFDPKVDKVDGIDLVEAGINSAFDQGAKRTAGVLELTQGDVFLLTSNDVEAKEKVTDAYFSIRSFAENDASGHKVGVSSMLKGLNVVELAKQSASIARNALNPRGGKSGKYDVLFEPLPFANMIDHFGSSTSIFSVEAGLSFLTKKIGKKVASSGFTLYDDGRLPNGSGSSVFDLEGVPTKKTKLVDKGVLKTYLHNTSTAKRYGVKTTGNAGLISPEPHNLVLQKGKYSKEQLISKIKKGLWVTNTWYTRFQDHVSGDFSTIPRDAIFYIENGKVKYPVKNLRITENLLNIMKNVKYIGNDVEQLRGWEVDTPCVTPSVLVKNVNITKPEN